MDDVHLSTARHSCYELRRKILSSNLKRGRCALYGFACAPAFSTIIWRCRDSHSESDRSLQSWWVRVAVQLRSLVLRSLIKWSGARRTTSDKVCRASPITKDHINIIWRCCDPRNRIDDRMMMNSSLNIKVSSEWVHEDVQLQTTKYHTSGSWNVLQLA